MKLMKSNCGKINFFLLSSEGNRNVRHRGKLGCTYVVIYNLETYAKEN